MSQKNIVFIDDEEDLVELFPLLFLDREDLNIKCFTTHPPALEYMNENAIDTLLIDYRMKDGTSIDFLDKLNGGFNGQVYIVTGELSLKPEESERVQGIIKKPFKKESFAEIL